MSSAPGAGRRNTAAGGRATGGSVRSERERRKSRLPLVLVVEDDAGLRRIIRRSLELSDFRVLEAQDGASALELASSEDLALILLDINLPAMDGLTVCKRVREFSAVYIMMITALGREEQIVRGLDAGADDYLAKPFGIDQLLARIRAVLRRTRLPERPSESAMYEYEGLTVDLAWHRVTVDGQDVPLTPTEYRLLACLVANAGLVLTQQQLLHKVWGEEYADERHILHVNIGRLRRKIEADPEQPRYVLTKTNIGYFVPRP
jgi:DNA-binding response OmpR family regulator